MYIVKHEFKNNRWEEETIEKLLLELEILNITHTKRGTSEDLVVYETNDNGEILKEIKLTLPINKALEKIFIIEEAKEQTKEVALKQNVEDLTPEEEAIFKNLHKENFTKETPKKDYKQKQREIIDKIKKNKQEESIQSIQTDTMDTNVEEENTKVSEPVNYKEEYQVAVESNNLTATIYEGKTLLTARDLKEQFILKIKFEEEKIEKQIYILERQLREYRLLKKSMDEIL